MTYWIKIRGNIHTIKARSGRVVAAGPLLDWTIGREAVYILDLFRSMGADIDWARNA